MTSNLSIKWLFVPVAINLVVYGAVFAEESPPAGLEIIVESSKQKYTDDERIVCTIRLVNKGKERKEITYAGALAVFKVKVERLLGKDTKDATEAKMTALGERWAEADARGERGSHQLGPGAEYKVRFNDLRRLFDMSIPGNYNLSVSVQRAMPDGSMPPASKPLSLEIMATNETQRNIELTK